MNEVLFTKICSEFRDLWVRYVKEMIGMVFTYSVALVPTLCNQFKPAVPPELHRWNYMQVWGTLLLSVGWEYFSTLKCGEIKRDSEL